MAMGFAYGLGMSLSRMMEELLGQCLFLGK